MDGWHPGLSPVYNIQHKGTCYAIQDTVCSMRAFRQPVSVVALPVRNPPYGMAWRARGVFDMVRKGKRLGQGSRIGHHHAPVRFRQEPHRKRQGLRLGHRRLRGGSRHAGHHERSGGSDCHRQRRIFGQHDPDPPRKPDPCGKGIQSRFPECLRDARIRQGQAHPVPQKNVGPLSARQMARRARA